MAAQIAHCIPSRASVTLTAPLNFFPVALFAILFVKAWDEQLMGLAEFEVFFYTTGSANRTEFFLFHEPIVSKFWF